MKILFITTTNLATNPRLVKEIQFASSLGCDIELIQFKINNWSDYLTQQIQIEFPNVKIIEIEAGRKPLIPWFFSSILEKLFSFLPCTIIPSNWLSISLNKRAFLINRNFDFISSKPDLIIAHNPGSFYSAMLLGARFQTEFAIDVEDYHPGETLNHRFAKRMKELMYIILPKAKYVSFASKLILEQVESDFRNSNLTLNKPTVIDNVFSRDEFTLVRTFDLTQSKLNFVWFSQNIDYSRGLESIFIILDEFSEEVSLTLIGNVRNGFYQNEISHRKYIQVEKPMAQNVLHSILSNFDIGLALETQSSNFNRDICLTNKIWSYLQSGVYILATSTRAQSDFIGKFPSNGEVIFENREQVNRQIKKLILDKEHIRQHKNERRMLNDVVNWENERCKLKSVWEL